MRLLWLCYGGQTGIVEGEWTQRNWQTLQFVAIMLLETTTTTTTFMVPEGVAEVYLNLPILG